METHRVRLILVSKGNFCKLEIWMDRGVGIQLVDAFEPLWNIDHIVLFLNVFYERLVEDKTDEEAWRSKISSFVKSIKENLPDFPQTKSEMSEVAKEEMALYIASRKDSNVN